MKKLLISILIVLLIVLAYFTIFEGLSFGNLSILSVRDINEANNTLTASIGQVNNLIKEDLIQAEEQVSTAIEEEQRKKAEYYDLAKKSTEGEIAKANTEESYEMEYLWTKIGIQASSKGVNIEMVTSNAANAGENMKNLAFTVEGQYVPIIQFISALENTAELRFRIEDFNMEKGSSNLKATFNVNGIRVKPETTITEGTTRTTAADNTNDTVE